MTHSFPTRRSADLAEFFVNVNNVYTSSFTTDPSNVSSAAQGAYSLLGANIGVELEDGKYRISIGGKNLTDAAYFNGTSLNVSQYFGQPRTVFAEFQEIGRASGRERGGQ